MKKKKQDWQTKKIKGMRKETTPKKDEKKINQV